MPFYLDPTALLQSSENFLSRHVRARIIKRLVKLTANFADRCFSFLEKAETVADDLPDIMIAAGIDLPPDKSFEVGIKINAGHVAFSLEQDAPLTPPPATQAGSRQIADS